MMTPSEPKVEPRGKYTVRQAAKELGVHENTIRNWLNRGIFRASEYSRRPFGHGGRLIRGSGIMRVWNLESLI